MRAIFGVLSLLIVVLVVGVLVKKQLGAVSSTPVPVTASAVAGAPVQPAATPQQQVQQVQQAVQDALQQAPQRSEEK